MEIPEFYFPTDTEWRAWLHENHKNYEAIYLVFYTVNSSKQSMRWEEAVRVALCYGWIDATVKKIDNEKRIQYFTHRKPKSVWSKVNKNHLKDLEKLNLIHPSGYEKIEIAKQNGSWRALDDVENLIIPTDLQTAFDKNETAFKNYLSFSKSYQKSYLYWLHQAKREQTRNNRIKEIINFCKQNIKSRN